jgi:hypothetical protein
MPRRFISTQEREAIFEAWENTCAYCEINPAQAVDHIIPYAKGGPCELENFAAICNRCNRMKSDKLIGIGFIGIIKTKAERLAYDIATKLDRPKKESAKCIRLKNFINKLLDTNDKHYTIQLGGKTYYVYVPFHYQIKINKSDIPVSTESFYDGVRFYYTDEYLLNISTT